MVLKLRLARIRTPGGAHRHHPRYNIVLAQARSARDSKPMEVLGTYNPIPQLPVGAAPGDRKQKDIKVDVQRTKYWLGVGAQPSGTVWRLMSMIGLLPPRYLPTGEQTQNALRAVRFPTHTTSEERREARWSRERSMGPIMAAQKAEKEAERVEGRRTGKAGRGEGRVGVSNTSPQDPNQA